MVNSCYLFRKLELHVAYGLQFLEHPFLWSNCAQHFDVLVKKTHHIKYLQYLCTPTKQKNYYIWKYYSPLINLLIHDCGNLMHSWWVLFAFGSQNGKPEYTWTGKALLSVQWGENYREIGQLFGQLCRIDDHQIYMLKAWGCQLNIHMKHVASTAFGKATICNCSWQTCSPTFSP